MSPKPTHDWISPRRVLEEVATAIPEELRGNVIVIGSLAAGYQLLPRGANAGLRTKDIDCMLSPRLHGAS